MYRAYVEWFPGSDGEPDENLVLVIIDGSVVVFEFNAIPPDGAHDMVTELLDSTLTREEWDIYLSDVDRIIHVTERFA